MRLHLRILRDRKGHLKAACGPSVESFLDLLWVGGGGEVYGIGSP